MINVEELAQPMDNKIIGVFKKIHFDEIVGDYLNKKLVDNFGFKLVNGFRLNETNYPTLYNIVKEIAEKLNIKMPRVIIDCSAYMNACTFGQDGGAYILVSDVLIRNYSPEELKFVIAHEMAHIALKHVTFHTAGLFIRDIFNMFFSADALLLPYYYWSRMSEASCDRIALACCEDLETAQKALIKLTCGFCEVENINVKDYINNSKEMMKELMFKKYYELEHEHPLIYKRLEALELFAYSELYYKTINKENALNLKLMTNDELIIKTDNILKIL